MPKTVVVRLYPSTLERLGELRIQGTIPRQLDNPAAQVDFVLDLFLERQNVVILKSSDNTAKTTIPAVKS